MYSVIKTAVVCGFESLPVQVETDVSDGMPSFDMVGFLTSEVKEARERVRTALKNAGFRLPAKKITINLTPADVRKSGTGCDLPMAASVSHKGIIIGKGGAMLKKIGSNARFEIEKLLEGKVNLRLWVKVRKGWRDSDIQMKNFGYNINE